MAQERRSSFVASLNERPEPIAFQTPDGGEKGTNQRFGSPNHALIDNRYKFLSYLDEARPDQDLLFDLSVDPGERYNIREQAPQVAARMKTRLQSWKQSCGRSEARR